MKIVFILLLTTYLCHHCLASKEITSLLESAPLSTEDKNALQPLFHELQKQYDYINSEANQNRDSMDTNFMMLYESTQQEFEHTFDTFLKSMDTSFHIDINFSNVSTLIDFSIPNLTESEQIEAQDIQSIIQELLDNVQYSIGDLEKLGRDMEAELIEIDKPKVVAAIYNALKKVFFASVRVSRAAYCSYSYIPQLNESLHYIHNGVDCYKYTIGVVQTIKREIEQALKAIRNYVEDLAKIYKDIQNKNSVVGKIFAIVLNVQNIKQDVEKINGTIKDLREKWNNEIPGAANGTKQCGSDFLSTLPQIVETVSNVTTCILFVDDSTVDYDFMKPEEEDNRDYN